MGTDSKFVASGDDSNLIMIWNVKMKDTSINAHLNNDLERIHVFRGHRSPVSGLTVRIWKIVEESQLVYNAPTVAYEKTGENSKASGVVGSASVDSIKLLDEQHFITCGEDGHISLWNVNRKKPVFTVPRAHGSDPTNNDPRWISAIATQHNTDLIASASCDGILRIWKCTERFRSLVEIAAIPINNYMKDITDEKSTIESWTSGFVN